MNIVPRLSSDGTKTYYTLELGRRKGGRFATGIFTYTQPKDKIQRSYNIQALANLETIKAQTLLDAQTKGRGFVSPAKLKENFFLYFEKYVKKNHSETNRSLPASLSSFKKFVAIDQGASIEELEEDLEAATNDLYICSGDISKNFCERFQKYLLDNLNGETPADYFMRFKKMISVAQEDGYFRENPTEKIKCKSHPTGIKDTLEPHEYKILLSTPCRHNEVRKAAVCSLYSGFRWCDVDPLTWNQIRPETIVLRRQSKTGVPLEIPLHPVVAALIGEPGQPGELVFKLPSYDTVLDILQDWVNAAGIQKKITWHCFRHSVSDILLDQGIDVFTVAAYLGQSDVTQVLRRYQHRVQKRNIRTAATKLPEMQTS